jgi:hypothetical protein
VLRSSSPDALARHLLRHLLDLRQLQRNELGAVFLRSLPPSDSDATRHDKTVRWARLGVETLAHSGDRKAALHGEILKRCDLRGEPHALVWRSLGLSRRAFYNERRCALGRLAMALSAAARRGATASPVRFDAFEVRLASARLLQAGGHLELAVREGELLAASAPSAAQRIRAHAVALESECLSGKLEDARRRLPALEAWLDPRGAGTPQELTAFLSASAACAGAHQNLGEPAQALERLRAAQRASRSHPKLLQDRQVADAWTEALLQLADFYAIAGSASCALSAIREASDLLAGWEDADPDARARLSISQANVLLTLDRPFAEAETSARAALAQAQRHGLVTRAVEAAAALCLVQAVSGNGRAALRTGQSALQVAERFRPHQAGIFLRLILARICALYADVRAANELLKEASRSIPKDSAIAVFHETAAASIDLSKGAFRAGLRRLQEATDGAQRSGFGRVTGAALALQARALSALGRAQAAATAVDAAVATLEKGGARYALADAYDLSGRLTGNRTHAKLANELRAILTRNAPVLETENGREDRAHRRILPTVRTFGHGKDANEKPDALRT